MRSSLRQGMLPLSLRRLGLQSLLSASLILAANLCLSQTAKIQEAVGLIRTGQSEQARKLLLEALQNDPKDERIHALLGQLEFRRKKYATSIQHFHNAPSILAHDPNLVMQCAEALLKTNSTLEATGVLATLPTSDAAAQFQAGLLLARFGGYSSAEKHFRLAGEGYPDQLAVGYNIALAQYNAGKFKESTVTLEGLRGRGLKSNDVLSLLAEAYVQTGELHRALDTLSEAVKDNPQDARNYLLAADIYDEADNPLMGLSVIDQALQHLPQSSVLLLERGYLNLVVSKFEEAEADYRRVLALQPNSVPARMGLAFVFLQSGRDTDATALLEDLVRSNPSSYFARYLLGDVYLRKGLDAKALSELRKAAELKSDFGAVHTDLGKLYLKKNQIGTAVQELETAVRLDPEDVTAYYQLSAAYRLQGSTEKTDKALEKVRRLNKEQGDLGMERFLSQGFREARRTALAQRDF